MTHDQSQSINFIPSIKTFVLALNEAGMRELMRFDIPTAGLDLDAGEHHHAAVREVKAMQAAGGRVYAAHNYVAFDEHEPAGHAFMAAAIPATPVSPAPAAVPRILIEIEGGLILKVESDSPVEVTLLDIDTEGADEDDIVDVTPAGGDFYVHRYSVSADEASLAAEHVAEVFTFVDDHAAEQLAEEAGEDKVETAAQRG